MIATFSDIAAWLIFGSLGFLALLTLAEIARLWLDR